MGYEDKEKRELRAGKPHSITLEDRAKLSVTGVEDVERFDDDAIVMLTARGALSVKGQGLHMERLSLDVGEVCIQGLVTELCYEETAPSGSLWSRLFG